MIRLLITFLKDNPRSGAAGTAGSFIAGIAPECAEIPKDDILFWFQIIAFTVTILVGLSTLYAQYSKRKSYKKNGKA